MKTKRILSLLIAVILCFSIIPQQIVFAAPISAVCEDATGVMDLTSIGDVDWIHFASTDERKNIPQGIIEVSGLNVGVINEMNDCPIEFTWSDGAVVTNAAGIKTGDVYVVNDNQNMDIPAQETGWALRIPTDAGARELIFTCGVWSAKMKVTINDEGATKVPYEQIIESPANAGAVNKKITAQLEPNTNYIIKGVYLEKYNNYGNMNISSAALRKVGVIPNNYKVEASYRTASDNLNLTEVGAIDWIHVSATDERKSIATPVITYQKLGSAQKGQFTDSPVSFSWTDGTTKAADSGVKTGGVFNSNPGNEGIAAEESGWKINVPSDAVKRELTFSCGGWSAKGRLVITADNDPQTAYIEEITAGAVPEGRIYKVILEAGKAYEAKFIFLEKSHAWGNLTLSSVALSPETANKSMLSSLMAYAGTLVEVNYTPDSWTGFNLAKTNAISILGTYLATQAQVDIAYQNLDTAINALMPLNPITRAQLGELYGRLKAADVTGYISVDTLNSELDYALTVLNDGSASAMVLEKAYNRLLAAVKGLKPLGAYTYQKNSGLTASIGWDGDVHAPIAFIDGTFILRDGGNRTISFGMTDIVGKIEWYNKDGYLPCFVSKYKNKDFDAAVEIFADKVVIGGNDFEVVYSRFTVTNTTASPKLLPVVSPELIGLNDATKQVFIEPGQTVIRDYAIAADRFGNTYAWPDASAVASAGGFDQHYTSMRAYWDTRLQDIASIKQLPDERLINAYKAGFIYTHIIKDGYKLHVGENGYDILFDHDTIGIVASLLTIGDFKDAREFLSTLPAQLQYDDAKWKYSWPFALYLRRTGDIDFIRQNFDAIKTNTHKITTDRINNGKGIIKDTFAIDSQGFWTIDNWSALTGLSTYRYICNELGETNEAKWATDEYNDLLAVVNSTLDNTIKTNNLNYIPVSMIQPNDANRCADPRDANWASMFLFGRWAWDGYLFNAHQEGVSLDMIDPTYDYGLGRLENVFPEYDFGGYPHGFYSSAYNAGYGSAALRGEKYRDSGIKAYQCMIEYAMSGPFSWWEGVDYPSESSPWNIQHAAGGGGSSQHMWGQSVATKVLFDAMISEKIDGKLIIGRGIPNEWFLNGKVIEITNYPIGNNKRLGFTTTSTGDTITLQMTGNIAEGNISFELPVFKNNIKAVSAGTFDNITGVVDLPMGTTTVTVTLIKEVTPPEKVEAPVLSSAQAQNNEINVKWLPVANADSYVVEYSYNNEIYKINTGKACEFTLKKPFFDIDYVFNVYAVKGEIKSGKSDKISCKLELPAAATGGSIVLTSATPSPTVNLTQTGKLDWIRSGNTVNDLGDRKKSGLPIISYNQLQKSPIVIMNDSQVDFSWTDGTKEAAVNSSRYGYVYIPARIDNNIPAYGWQIIVPADTKERVLKIYTSIWSAKASYKAFLSDNSANIVIDSIESKDSSLYREYTIRYKAKSSSQYLYVRSMTDIKHHPSGNNTLLAATLDGEPFQQTGIDTSISKPTPAPITESRIDLNQSQLDSFIKEAKADKDGNKIVKIVVPEKAGSTTFVSNIPGNAFTDKKDVKYEIKSQIGTVVLPAEMFTGSSITLEKTNKVELVIKKAEVNNLPVEIANRPVLDISLQVNNSVAHWNNANTPVKVQIPYIPTAEELKKPESITVFYIDGAGKIHAVPSGKYVAATGTVEFYTTHFSKYAIAYVVKEFSDYGAFSWAKKEIEMMAAKGILNGTSATTYSPAEKITRGEFLRALVDILGLNADVSSNFDDVSPNANYYKAIGIAKALGIVGGVGGNKYAPHDAISRQDMMVITVRALEKAGKLDVARKADLNTFSDKKDISGYASNAVSLMIGNGLINGSRGFVKPKNDLSKAEAAVILCRIYNK